MSVDFTGTNIEAKPTKVKQSVLSTGDLSSTKSNEVKEKPSLFDKLLGSAKQVQKDTSTKKDDVLTKSEKTNNTATKQDKDSIQTKSDKTSKITADKNIKEPSLLDKMIMDAKKVLASKDKNIEISKDIKSENKTKDIPVKEEIVTKDKKNETAAASKDKNIEISKDIKSENKTKDIPVKEEIVTKDKKNETAAASKDKNIEISKDIKSENKTKDIPVKEEIVTKDKKNETAAASKDKNIEISKDIKSENKTKDIPVKEEIVTKDKKNETAAASKDKNIEISKDIKSENKTKDIPVKEEIVTKDKKNETAAASKDKNIEISKDIKSENKTKYIPVKEEIVETNNKSDITTLKDKNENLVDNTEYKDDIKAISSDKPSLFNSIINELPKEVRKNIVDDIKEIKLSSKQLISESKVQQTKIDLSKDTKQTITKQQLEKTNVNITQKDNISANMFLGAQKNANELGKIQKITQSKKVLEEIKTTTGVKKSADILELNATDIEITTDSGEKKIEVVKKDTQIKSINSFLDKLILEQNKHIKNLINQPTTVFPTASKIIEKEKAQTSESTKIKETIELTVPNNVAQIFTSKIIGARQQVGSFMSEVARNMYLNYKPPVTTFRFNLNPASLGSISIRLKSNKAQKSMSVSMNMSSTATLESFIDNKASLQSALQRNFSETGSNISLSFGMQSDSSNHAFEQAKQEQNNNQSQDIYTEQTLIDDEIIQDTQDYM